MAHSSEMGHKVLLKPRHGRSKTNIFASRAGKGLAKASLGIFLAGDSSKRGEKSTQGSRSQQCLFVSAGPSHPSVLGAAYGEGSPRSPRTCCLWGTVAAAPLQSLLLLDALRMRLSPVVVPMGLAMAHGGTHRWYPSLRQGSMGMRRRWDGQGQRSLLRWELWVWMGFLARVLLTALLCSGDGKQTLWPFLCPAPAADVSLFLPSACCDLDVWAPSACPCPCLCLGAGTGGNTGKNGVSPQPGASILHFMQCR